MDLVLKFVTTFNAEVLADGAVSQGRILYEKHAHRESEMYDILLYLFNNNNKNNWKESILFIIREMKNEPFKLKLKYSSFLEKAFVLNPYLADLAISCLEEWEDPDSHIY